MLDDPDFLHDEKIRDELLGEFAEDKGGAAVLSAELGLHQAAEAVREQAWNKGMINKMKIMTLLYEMPYQRALRRGNKVGVVGAATCGRKRFPLYVYKFLFIFHRK